MENVLHKKSFEVLLSEMNLHKSLRCSKIKRSVRELYDPIKREFNFSAYFPLRLTNFQKRTNHIKNNNNNKINTYNMGSLKWIYSKIKRLLYCDSEKMQISYSTSIS